MDKIGSMDITSPARSRRGVGRPPWPATVLAAALVVFCLDGPSPAAVYVVDSAHPGASDSGQGDENAPFGTLNHAAGIAAAGDTVLVMPGVYPGTLKPANSGLAGKPIVFLAVSDGDTPGGQVVVEGGSPGVDLRGKAYIRLEGFEIRRTTGGEGHGVFMDDGENIQILRCHIHHTAGTGVVVQRGTDCVVSECYIHHVGGTGIHAGGLTYRAVRCRFLRNHIHDNGVEDGIQMGSGDDCEISWNYVHDIWAPPPSHTDGIQLHSDNRNYRIIGNVVHRIRSEGFMIGAEGAEDAKDRPASAPRYERNIMSDGGGVSFILSHGVRKAFLLHNTILWGRGQSVWIHRNSTENTVIGNILQSPDGGCIVTPDSREGLAVDYNLTAAPNGEKGPHGLRGDPMVVDPKRPDAATLPNARLRPGSPAIDAGPEGSDIGALEYPNVYYVDPAHPAATDEFYGYRALPFRTLEKALETAAAGETIILRAGVFRLTAKPPRDGVALKAFEGETVVISGADRVTGWTRTQGGWSAGVPGRPVKMLMDGRPLTDYTFDEKLSTVTLRGFDPRLHAIENVLREHAVDLTLAPRTTIEGVRTADTLAAPIHR